MIKQIFNKLLNTIKNLDKKILKILNYGLKFCVGILILSAGINRNTYVSNWNLLYSRILCFCNYSGCNK